MTPTPTPTLTPMTDYDPGPSDVQANTVTIETRSGDQFNEIMTKQQLARYAAQVKTMYKRKDKKIRPANIPLSGGVNPGGGVNSESKDSRLGTDLGMRLGPSDGGRRVPRRSRLMPKWLAKMKIGTGFRSENEK